MAKTWTDSTYEATFDVSPSPFSSIAEFSRFVGETLHFSPGPIVRAETFASGRVMLLDEKKRKVLMVYAEMQVCWEALFFVFGLGFYTLVCRASSTCVYTSF